MSDAQPAAKHSANRRATSVRVARIADMISFGDLPPLLGALRKVGAAGADEVFKA